MATMTKKERQLLISLKAVRDSGGASRSVHGSELRVAHLLENRGFIEWHGQSWGSMFYYITDKGVEYLENEHATSK